MCIIDSKKRAIHLVFKKGGPGNPPIKAALSTSITLASIETKTEGFREPHCTLQIVSCLHPFCHIILLFGQAQVPSFQSYEAGMDLQIYCFAVNPAEDVITPSCKAAYIAADTYIVTTFWIAVYIFLDEYLFLQLWDKKDTNNILLVFHI